MKKLTSSFAIVKHPGGDEILIDEGARDATGPFEDVGHSPDAREMLEKYYVGDVDPEVSSKTSWCVVKYLLYGYSLSLSRFNKLLLLRPPVLHKESKYFKDI